MHEIATEYKYHLCKISLVVKRNFVGYHNSMDRLPNTLQIPIVLIVHVNIDTLMATTAMGNNTSIDINTGPAMCFLNLPFQILC